jgi:hypothetical protein
MQPCNVDYFATRAQIHLALGHREQVLVVSAVKHYYLSLSVVLNAL